MKLSDAINGHLLFRSTHCSETTVETDDVVLGQFVTWLDDDPNVTDITSDTIRAYLEHLETRKLSPHTIRRHHAALSALYTWLSSPEIAIAKTNPVKAVKPPKEPKKKIRELEIEAIEKMLQAADKIHTPRRARAMILFMLDTATRASEIADVTLADVNLRTGRVLIRGKGDKERYVYAGKRARSALWLYIQDERPEPAIVVEDRLFLTYDGYPMNRDSIRHAIYRLAKHAGVKAYPHLFRHSGAIERLRNGMNVFTLKEMMGHEQLKTTEKYLTALSDEDVERQARVTSPADNAKL